MAVAMCLWVGTGTVRSAGDDAVVAKAVTKEEAAKKYPAPRGGYPRAEVGHLASGIYKSPYPPYTTFDCRGIKGQMVLDSHVNKVFLLP